MLASHANAHAQDSTASHNSINLKADIQPLNGGSGSLCRSPAALRPAARGAVQNAGCGSCDNANSPFCCNNRASVERALDNPRHLRFCPIKMFSSEDNWRLTGGPQFDDPMPILRWNAANVPFAQHIAIETECLGQPGLSAKLPDQATVEVDALAHATQYAGILPPIQAGYLPPERKRRMGQNRPYERGAWVMAKQKRPDAYSEVQLKIGHRIKWARELIEPNRAEFAREMGVDRSTLQKIEDGSRPPSVFNVIDLAHRLQVTPDYILTGSLKGVDGELAGRLVALHPELAPDNNKGTDSGTSPPPKRPRRA